MYVVARRFDVGVTEQFPTNLQVRGLADHHRRVGVTEAVRVLAARDPGLGQQQLDKVGERPVTHASPVRTGH